MALTTRGYTYSFEDGFVSWSRTFRSGDRVVITKFGDFPNTVWEAQLYTGDDADIYDTLVGEFTSLTTAIEATEAAYQRMKA